MLPFCYITKHNIGNIRPLKKPSGHRMSQLKTEEALFLSGIKLRTSMSLRNYKCISPSFFFTFQPKQKSIIINSVFML